MSFLPLSGFLRQGKAVDRDKVTYLLIRMIIMIYEFNSEDTVDDLKFKTNMLVEKYEIGLSIESQCISEFLTINSISQYNEVTVVISHDEAIKLRDTLNAMYPVED